MSAKDIEAFQKKLSDEISKFGALQKSYQKTLQLRQQLDSQLNENNIVKEVKCIVINFYQSFNIIFHCLIGNGSLGR